MPVGTYHLSRDLSLRIGYLYGSFNKDQSVKVEVIYEPPQDNTDTTFNILEDPNEEKVRKLASMLGLEKVGWIFAHPTRETGSVYALPWLTSVTGKAVEMCYS